MRDLHLVHSVLGYLKLLLANHIYSTTFEIPTCVTLRCVKYANERISKSGSLDVLLREILWSSEESSQRQSLNWYFQSKLHLQ